MLVLAGPATAQRLHDPDRQPPIHPLMELLWGIQGWNFWFDGSPPTVVLQAPDHVWNNAALQSPAAAMLLRAYRDDPGLYYAEPLGFGRDAMVSCGGRKATRLGAVADTHGRQRLGSQRRPVVPICSGAARLGTPPHPRPGSPHDCSMNLPLDLFDRAAARPRWTRH